MATNAKALVALLLVALACFATSGLASGVGGRVLPENYKNYKQPKVCYAKNLYWTTKQCCEAAYKSYNEPEHCVGCVKKVGEQKAYACVECTKLYWYKGVDYDCQECVAYNSYYNREWVCHQVCFNNYYAPSAGVAKACATCYYNADKTDGYGCGDCLKYAVALAKYNKLPINHPQIEKARYKCLKYVNYEYDVWAGPECLKKYSLKEAHSCLDCLLKGKKKT